MLTLEERPAAPFNHPSERNTKAAQARRVLIAMETPSRDIKTAAILAFWLRHKYGYFPIITTSQNELAAIIRYQPDMVVFPHLRYGRLREAVRFAKRQGTQVAILPSEGLVASDDLIPKLAVGIEEFYPDVDLLLSWGSHVAAYLQERRLLPKTTFASVGCPRFDPYRSFYKSLLPTREAFCARYGIDPAKPILLWMSNTAYAHQKEDPEVLAAAAMAKGRSADFVNREFGLADIIRDHQAAYEFMEQLLLRHSRENPGLTYLLKPHPAEDPARYHDVFGALPNVRILDKTALLEDLFAHRAVQLTWRCSTSIETWLADIQTPILSLESPACRLPYVAEYTVGNDLVSDYAAFDERVSHYLRGGAVSADLVARRKDFLERYLAIPQTSSGEAAADAIDRFLAQRPRPHWSMQNWAASARYWTKHWAHARRLTMERGPGHPKYFHPDEVGAWMRKFNRLFNSHVESQHYDIFA